jgi:4-hydroxy-tetrahydrodipicolinate reductase
VESLLAVADCVGFALDDVQESLEPRLADREITSGYQNIPRGGVAGIVHRARGLCQGVEKVSLHLEMYVGAPREYDSVVLDGTPSIKLTVDGGIFGDQATIARMVNAIPVVHSAPPGLSDVFKLPAISYWP